MKVYLDRRVCNVWEAACESDLAWHIDNETYCPACLVEVIEDDSPEVQLFIKKCLRVVCFL